MRLFSLSFSRNLSFFVPTYSAQSREAQTTSAHLPAELAAGNNMKEVSNV